jgi:hypothetical protein
LFLIEVDEFQKIPEVSFQQNRARKIFFKFIHHKGKQVTQPVRKSVTRVVE